MKYLFTITNKKLILLLFALAFYLLAVAKEPILPAPDPFRFVNDFANILSDEEKQKLELQIRAIESETSNQIAVVTVSDLDGKTPANYAQQIGEDWGVGQKDKDNGIVILIKPKYPNEKGEVYIAVGYGLESVIPDIMAKRIIDNVIIPNFKNEDIFLGLSAAITMINSITKGEYTNNFPESDTSEFEPGEDAIFPFLTLLVILLPFAYITYARRRNLHGKYSEYYVQGKYNAENVIKQVEKLEKKLDKKYSKFKKIVLKLELTSKNKLYLKAQRIDRQITCMLLGNQKRVAAFWKYADPFLKGLVFYLLIMTTLTTLLGLVLGGFFVAFILLILSLGIAYIKLSFLLSFLEIKRTLLRGNGKYAGGISIAIFALSALIKRSIKRKFNKETGLYYYAPVVVLTSSYSGGSSYGGYSGGSFGGGGGSFGGGSFGGGGAGGSW